MAKMEAMRSVHGRYVWGRSEKAGLRSAYAVAALGGGMLDAHAIDTGEGWTVQIGDRNYGVVGDRHDAQVFVELFLSHQ